MPAQGKDLETELRQRAKEVGLMRELGLDVVSQTPARDADRGPL